MQIITTGEIGMKHLKILSLILAILMLIPMVLAGCAKDEGGKQGDGQGINVVKETEDKSAIYDSEIHDMHGHEFWFLVRETTHQHLATNEVYAEELSIADMLTFSIIMVLFCSSSVP